LLEPVEDRLWREHADPRGRELDRKRQPVQPLADRSDGVARCAGQRERRTRRARSLDEQQHGVGRVELVRVAELFRQLHR
jgi:hypothetical protein